jgi:predicted transcriptional regulator YheO
VVDSLALTLGPHYEFVIHDFADPAHSLIHIAGNITKRGVGAPLTGRLLKAYREHGDNVQDILNVQLKGPDGRPIRSSSIFIRNANGKVIGSLGVNIDLSDYQAAKRLIDNLCLGVKTMETEALQPTSDAQFPNTYAEAIDEILNETVQSHSRFLDKDQRMELVRELDNKGVFLMKGAVEEVASRLGVSKFSIYKYLKELRTDGDTNEASGS